MAITTVKIDKVEIGQDTIINASQISDAGAAFPAFAQAETAQNEADLLPVGSATQTALNAKATKNGEGINFVVVDVSGGTSALNGVNLLASYAAAKLLTPNGAALSATNRATVILPPATYNLVTTPLALNTQFVDIVGLTGDPKHVIITSQVVTNNSGTVVQTANDVHGSGITIQNTASTRGFGSDAACAYCHNDSLANTIWTNCKFDDGGGTSYSTSINKTCSGTFISCIAADKSLGYLWDFAGTAKDCVTGNESFGSEASCSGTISNCTAGTNSFGVTCSATLTNCTAGTRSFGDTTFSGTATNCTGGTSSFGRMNFTGKATGCLGDSGSFGGLNTLTGKLYFCRLIAGSYQTVSGAGKTRYCIDGSDVVNNQG